MSHNAAPDRRPSFDTPIEDKQRILDVNVRGPVIAAHVLGERMAARGRGGIILVSSLTAFWGSAWVATYGASKAFNLSLGEALAQELGERGVDVVVSCAGATRTPGFVSLVAGRRAPRAWAGGRRRKPERTAGRGVFVPGAGNRSSAPASRLLPRRTAVRSWPVRPGLLGRGS